MKTLKSGKLLRIFIGESARYEGRPLYEWIVVKAKESGLMGATVIRGIMGFGARSLIHSAKIMRLSMDLPVIIEIVDSEEKIMDFISIIEDIVEDGLITLEKAEIKFYGPNS